MTRGAPGATVTTAAAGAFIGAADLHLAAPLFFGACGVILARIVFVDRENRRLRRAQSVRETLPLTLVAVLIMIAIVVEMDLNLPKAIFAGLATGWVAIAFLDVIGDRVLAMFSSQPTPRERAPDPAHAEALARLWTGEPPATPPDMAETLRKLDEPPQP